MNKKNNYSWIEKIESSLLELDEIPNMPMPFEFNFKDYAKEFEKAFNIKNVSFSVSSIQWKSNDNILEGMGENLVPLAFCFTPLKGNVYWVMSEKDITKLTSWILLKQQKEKEYISAPLQEGFYRYLMLENLKIIERMEHFDDFSIKIVENIEAKETNAFCMDIQCKYEDKSCWGRLIISPAFRKAWKEYFSSNISYIKTFNRSFEVTLRADIAKTNLKNSDLQKINVGDFIVLDEVSLDPYSEKGLITLMIGNTPLFYAKIKDDKLKIVDYATYQKDDDFMSEEIIKKNNEEPKEKEPINEENEQVKEKTSLEEAFVSINDIKTTLTIEIARMKITLEKLLNMQPGNMLELSVTTKQPVNLSVNGQIIGKAELIQLGDILGVRILEIKK